MWFDNKGSRRHSTVKNRDYAPNSAETAHFARKFRKRRRFQRWLVALFLLLPLATVGAIYWYREELFLDGQWQHPSVVTLVIIAMFIVAELAVITISLVNWRCSHCERLAPFRPHPQQCGHCGAPLRSSELSK